MVDVIRATTDCSALYSQLWL